MVIRRGNSRRYVPWLQYLAIVGRRVVETVGGMLHAMFPRRIHAVTQEGFVIKVLSFVLAHNLKLLTQDWTYAASTCTDNRGLKSRLSLPAMGRVKMYV
jgi:uncharacterized membrane-anchored protein